MWFFAWSRADLETRADLVLWLLIFALLSIVEWRLAVATLVGMAAAFGIFALFAFELRLRARRRGRR